MPILLEEFIGQLWQGDPNFHLSGTGEGRPPGLEALLEYNGMVMNDRKVIDKYRILEIDGLADADIRDQREANPSDHGETAFPSYYGGRTITITGRIEAGNINKLRDMQQALHYAFQDLHELPLIFRLGDVNRDVFINAKKSASIAMRESQQGYQFWRDFMVTLRASNPRIRSVLERISSFSFGAFDDFSTNVFMTGAWILTGGAATPAVSGGSMIPPVSSATVRKQMAYDPVDVRTTAQLTTGSTISANDHITLYLRKKSATTWLAAVFTFETPTTGRLLIQRSINGIAEFVAQTGTFAVAPGQTRFLRFNALGNALTATLHDVDPFQGGAAVQTLAHTLTGSDISELGEGVSGKIEMGLRAGNNAGWGVSNFWVEPRTINNQNITARNAGSFPAQPVVKLTGPMTNAQVVVERLLPGESTFRSFKINGVIPEGSTYTYDVAAHTLVDHLGANHFSQLDVGSKDILLPYGETPITVIAESTSGITPAVEIAWRDTWI